MGNRQPSKSPYDVLKGWSIVPGGIENQIYKNNTTGEKIAGYPFLITDISYLKRQKQAYQMRFNSLTLVASKFFIEATQSDMCTTHYRGDIFLQYIPYRLSQIDQIPYPDVLHLYSQCFKGFGQLFKYAGYFDVTEDLICINQKGEVKVWLNSSLQKVRPDISYGGFSEEVEMIHRIIKIIDKNTNNYTLPESIAATLLQLNISAFSEAEACLLKIASRLQQPIPSKLQSAEQLIRRTNPIIPITDSINFSKATKIQGQKIALHQPYLTHQKTFFSQPSSIKSYSLNKGAIPSQPLLTPGSNKAPIVIPQISPSGNRIVPFLYKQQTQIGKNPSQPEMQGTQIMRVHNANLQNINHNSSKLARQNNQKITQKNANLNLAKYKNSTGSIQLPRSNPNTTFQFKSKIKEQFRPSQVNVFSKQPFHQTVGTFQSGIANRFGISNNSSIPKHHSLIQKQKCFINKTVHQKTKNQIPHLSFSKQNDHKIHQNHFINPHPIITNNPVFNNAKDLRPNKKAISLQYAPSVKDIQKNNVESNTQFFKQKSSKYQIPVSNTFAHDSKPVNIVYSNNPYIPSSLNKNRVSNTKQILQNSVNKNHSNASRFQNIHLKTEPEVRLSSTPTNKIFGVPAHSQLSNKKYVQSAERLRLQKSPFNKDGCSSPQILAIVREGSSIRQFKNIGSFSHEKHLGEQYINIRTSPFPLQFSGFKNQAEVNSGVSNKVYTDEKIQGFDNKSNSKQIDRLKQSQQCSPFQFSEQANEVGSKVCQNKQSDEVDFLKTLQQQTLAS